MSISDDTMWTYFKYLLEFSDEQIQKQQQLHPMHVKKMLATALVSKFFGEDTAQHELVEFDAVFSKNEMPTDMPEIQLSQATNSTLIEVMHATGIFDSKKEIRRLIDQGAVKVNSEKVDVSFIFTENHLPSVVQSGKRIFFRVVQ